MKTILIKTMGVALLSGFGLYGHAAIEDTCETVPYWDSELVYTQGDVIQYAGKSFEAKWWIKNHRPNADNEYGPWKLVNEACLIESDKTLPLPLTSGSDLTPFVKVPENDLNIEVYRNFPGIYTINEKFTEVEFENVNAYLIVGTKQALLFDSGLGLGNIRQIIDQLTDKPLLLVNSHWHYDHVASNTDFPFIMAADDEYTRIGQQGLNNLDLIEFLKRAYGPYYKDVGPDYHIKPYHVDIYLRDKTKINLGSVELEVITAPGHSPDSIVLLDEERKLMYTGDVFYESVLFAHLPESNLKVYNQSAQKLAALQDKVARILPNHSIPFADGQALTRMANLFTAIINGEPGYAAGENMLYYNLFGLEIIIKESDLAEL
ncbi:MBL fold metallo-hydrolase [Teredinibacter sp. KSP-S5-2]|uniref:MBL fold metallo-hydrolase n=1 Tax=Teredinibacter sp. KSP-S5-2 TaxID=3034506 RepID=UPI002935261F|nr:MBL fold metallo-hydrolase [Teredinibacter sp. KSP-S5-2]WNO08843.1 MBL fold metallo-hydrolase [Teredinibacter sp. KSP-S5-2]